MDDFVQLLLVCFRERVDFQEYRFATFQKKGCIRWARWMIVA